jgi:hypothetical protein
MTIKQAKFKFNVLANRPLSLRKEHRLRAFEDKIEQAHVMGNFVISQ